VGSKKAHSLRGPAFDSSRPLLATANTVPEHRTCIWKFVRVGSGRVWYPINLQCWSSTRIVTVPSRITFRGGESIMPLRFLPSAHSVNSRGMDDPSFLRVSFPHHGFYLLLNDLSDWYKYGHKELDLGNSYLRTRLHHIFFYRHVARYKRRAFK
jgi:hypothetical protein